MKIKKVAVLALVLLAVGLSLTARVTKREEAVSISTAGLQCKKIITDTDWKPNGSGDWLKPNHMLSFRTTNKRAANVKVDKARSSFNNCKLVYSSAYASSSGEWSSSGIQVEAIIGNKPWNYNLVWDVEWKGQPEKKQSEKPAPKKKR